MARFNINDVDNYNTGGSGSFFMLKDDGDKARVRFLYDELEDIEGYAVHKVLVGDKERWVNCLRNYDEPIENCPLCAARYKLQTRLFLNVFNIDANEVQIWERGKTYYNDLKTFCSRYKPLYNGVIEITRSGKKGDTSTKYIPFPLEVSDFDMNEVELVSPLGTIILDKTYDELDYYVYNGSFPDGKNEKVRNEKSAIEQPQRRTPNTGRRVF